MGSWKLWAKRLMFLSTFTAPFYVIFPTNIGFYELLIILSALCLTLSKKSWHFPDLAIIFSLILILAGYLFSTWNTIVIQENIAFMAQFGFIVLIQFPVILTLTETINDFYSHVYALLISMMVLSCIFIYNISHNYTSIVEETTLIYTNYNILAIFLMMMIIPSSFLLYHSCLEDRPIKRHVLYAILFVGTVSMFSTQSRRIFPAIISIIVIIITTSFFSILEIKRIKKRVVASLPLIPLSFGIVLIGLLQLPLFARMRRTLKGDRSGNGIERRVTLIETGFDVMGQLFPLGTGYNNYGYYAQIPKPHNLFLEPFVEGGVLAGVGVFIFFTLIIIRSFRGIFIRKDIDPVAASFPLTTFALVIAHMFGTLLIYRFFWLIPILAYSSCHYGSR